MPGDHYASLAAFLPANARTAVNAVIANHLAAGAVTMSREPRSRQARQQSAFPASLDIVWRGVVRVPIGTGFLEERHRIDLIYTASTKDIPEGTSQADRQADIVRALAAQYDGRNNFAVAGLVRTECAGSATVDDNPGSSELVRSIVSCTFAFLQAQEANTV